MALFSQRFWLRLASLDSKVVLTQRNQHQAISRLLIGRRLVVGSSLDEYWYDMKQATRAAKLAADELNHFCSGRSKSIAVLPRGANDRGVETAASLQVALPR